MTMMLDLKDEKDEVGCRKVDCDGRPSKFRGLMLRLLWDPATKIPLCSAVVVYDGYF